MRGFVTGAVLGVAVSGLGLAAASYLAEPVVLEPRLGAEDLRAASEGAGEAPETVGVEVPKDASEPHDASEPEPTPERVAEPEPNPTPDAPAPEVAADAPDAPSGAGEDSAAPRPREAEAAPELPAAPGVLAASPDARPVSVAETPPPGAPKPDEVTAPAPPPAAEAASAPDGEEAGPDLAALAPEASEGAPPAAAADPSVIPDPRPETPRAGDSPPAAPSGEAGEDAPAGAPATDTPPAGIADVTPPEPATPDAAPRPGEAPAAAPEAEEVAESDETGEAPEADDGPAALRLPVPEIENLAPGASVLTDRLPRIGDGAATTPDADAALDAPDAPAAPGAVPALTAYAIPFDAPEGTPLLSVLLLDPGPGRPDPQLLQDFPVPLTIGLDPTLPGAAEALAAYRRAGVEVAVLAPLPDGAAPADVEQAFQVYLKALPETVAVLDVPEARMQENRARAAQVAEILKATGHGMITFERGLNSGLQVVRAEGVAAEAVFREFDDGGRNVAAMKRFLDLGAFRAAQQDGVLMTGVMRPETLTALAEWTLGNRAASVTLAPASALLRSR